MEGQQDEPFTHKSFCNMNYNDNNRRMRLSLFFETQDEFYHYNLWPPWAKATILNAHKTNRDRYRLFLFLTWNGLYPPTAVEWIKAKDIDPKGLLIYENYDKEAHRHFFQLLNQVQTGQLFRQARNIYDMHTMTVENKRS